MRNFFMSFLRIAREGISSCTRKPKKREKKEKKGSRKMRKGKSKELKENYHLMRYFFTTKKREGGRSLVESFSGPGHTFIIIKNTTERIPTTFFYGANVEGYKLFLSMDSLVYFINKFHAIYWPIFTFCALLLAALFYRFHCSESRPLCCRCQDNIDG